jgi:hypothetical protein
MGKPHRMKQLGRNIPMWDDNIKMDLKEIRCKVWTGFI